ncbi:rod shape-determining protein RodA [Anaerosalibacter bizertensis]|uniref:Peptidoglycan glycosyltransferase RodA n=1 Tax=Anaerosalibacter bizertensis TaxID=932217 RepID=A0A844FE07_9FIRM|nr:rod shape-determining protein RodA [Anaerosalibacter bizertensis]MSS42211.1 rod shape-determining protein RodA [Anaerosalibacter bizertensis]HHV26443.1 rod shape-determining protein RodA [Tissierellia bacterium]
MIDLKKKFSKRFDFVLFTTVALLCLYGIIMVMSATASLNRPRLIKVQIIATILGLITIIILSLVDYKILGNFYIPIYIFCNLLLLAVLIFGTGDKDWGARSWLSIGGFAFQPAELAKIAVIISVAKMIDKNKKTINQPFVLLKVLLFAGVPIGLIAIQPDFGTAVVFVFFVFVMLFAAGLKLRYFGYAIIIGIISLPILWFSFDGYQRKRILNFLDPEHDTSDSGYQAMQAKIAVGSGKLHGRGLFKGVQTQFGYIPEKHTDLIFAVIGEELGLIGGLILFALYFLMLYRLIKIAKETKDTFGSLMVVGIAAMLGIHIWENIGMTIGLMPITGIPLPFISYGGTFLLVNMICIGIALSVGMKKEGLKF